MYTTVKKYQFGIEELCHINMAILETLRTPKNKTATVIHAYQKTFLVECDLGKKYRLDATQLLYRTQAISNFYKFKNGAAPEPLCVPNVFIMDVTTGLWQSRCPDYVDDDPDLFMGYHPDIKDEAWCVHSMLAATNDPAEYVIRSYCCPVPMDYSEQGMHADMVIIGNEDYNAAQRRFNSAFQISAIRWQNKKANTL